MSGKFGYPWAILFLPAFISRFRSQVMDMVTHEIGKFAKKHGERLFHHVNVEAIQLLDNSELVRRLERK
jgi:hypothetical protein